MKSKLILVILFTLLILSSCFTVPKEEIEIHRYAIHPAGESVPADTVLPISIRIAPFSADAVYRGNRMIYRDSKGRTEHYYYYRWLAPPEDQFADLLTTSFYEWNLFSQGVFQVGNGLVPDYEISCRLNKLYAVNIRKDYHAALEMDVILTKIDPADYNKTMIFQKRYEFVQPRKDGNVGTFSAAVDTLTFNWFTQLRGDLLPVLQEHAENSMTDE